MPLKETTASGREPGSISAANRGGQILRKVQVFCHVPDDLIHRSDCQMRHDTASALGRRLRHWRDSKRASVYSFMLLGVETLNTLSIIYLGGLAHAAQQSFACPSQVSIAFAARTPHENTTKPRVSLGGRAGLPGADTVWQ